MIPFDFAHVAEELRRLMSTGEVSPSHRFRLEVFHPADPAHPVFEVTTRLGQFAGGTPAASVIPNAGPAVARDTPTKVYKLDRVEKFVLRTLGERYPQPMTGEEIAAAGGKSTGWLTYKNRMTRLQREGLLVNRNDHDGYALTEEGERVAGDLLAEPDK